MHRSNLDLLAFINQLEAEVEILFKDASKKSEENHFKVLKAFQDEGINDFHFNESTGYGYGDSGRDSLDNLYARIFGAEAGLVRPQMVSGTHAIALCLFGLLRLGDELLSITGSPYDTLNKVIGEKGQEGTGTLFDWGVSHQVINLLDGGIPDYDTISRDINDKTKIVAIQRSRGYSIRPSLGVEKIEKMIKEVKKINKDLIIFVDNCYGEFVEHLEPSQVGADIVAGSLIKNPGGGIAPSGGYIVGREDLIEKISYRLTAPGLGRDIGSSLTSKRLYYQGLFLAPLVVTEALKGAIMTAKIFSELGYQVYPGVDEDRADIIQAIILGSKEKIITFCQGLQKGSPIDSLITPIPSAMPGYADQIIMAGGTFIQGSSIELSADAPLREPYAVYLQGGLSYPYIKAALLSVMTEMRERGMLKFRSKS